MTNTLVCALHQYLPHAYMLANATSSDMKRTKSIFTMSSLKDFNIMFSVCDMKCLRAKCNIAINNHVRAEDLTVKGGFDK